MDSRSTPWIGQLNQLIDSIASQTHDSVDHSILDTTIQTKLSIESTDWQMDTTYPFTIQWIYQLILYHLDSIG